MRVALRRDESCLLDSRPERTPILLSLSEQRRRRTAGRGKLLQVTSFENDDEDDGSSFDDPLKEEKEKERTTEQFVKSCAKAAIELEKNASFGLIVSVQELKNDGSFLSCALNAVGLALILSGVETKGWMCSSTACLMK